MLIGHKRPWEFLTKSAQRGKLAHAYLFYGPAEVGKRTLAWRFSQWLLCQNRKNQNETFCSRCSACQSLEKNQHPDFFWLEPPREENKGIIKTLSIGIDEIKKLQHQLSLTPYSADYKIALIDGLEYLTDQALNSFLKILEEPPRQSLIFLIATDWQGLLPTIISRCQLIKFLPVPEKEIFAGLKERAVLNDNLRRIVKLAVGRPGRAIKMLENKDLLLAYNHNVSLFEKILKQDLSYRFELVEDIAKDNLLAQEFLGQFSLWLRDQLLLSSGLSDLAIDEKILTGKRLMPKVVADCISFVEQTRRFLSNPSFNAKLALEVLMLKL